VASGAGIPARFNDPVTAVPSEREISGVDGYDRFRTVGSARSPLAHEQYVTAVSLTERRFADVSAALHPELPPAEAALATEYIVTDATGLALSRCVIEPNLVRTGERLTAISADWILAQGRPHLLVGFGSDAGAGPWPIFYRLYNPRMQLVWQTEPVLMVDPNRAPQPVMSDLNGDGAEEIVVFSNMGTGPALAVLQPDRADVAGNRVLALAGCGQRMNGADVVELQRVLERRGYTVGPHGIDGWYGPDTRAAIIAFQRDQDLPVTGVVDAATWHRLGL
jgi:hypothetical protein